MNKSVIKQEVKGDNNKTYIIKGLSAMDAYKLAYQLFKDNFPSLQQQAVDKVNERIEEIINRVIEKCSAKKISDFSSFKEPDVQYTLNETMKSYARYGNKDVLDILTDLVINRMETSNDLKLKIAIDEAVALAQKLTKNSLNYLTFLFVCKRVKLDNIEKIKDLEYIMRVLLQDFPFDINDFHYLNSLGCFCLDIDKPFERLSKIYNIKTEEIYSKIPSIINKLTSDYSLTYPAIVLAILNFNNNSLGIELDLKVWIH